MTRGMEIEDGPPAPADKDNPTGVAYMVTIGWHRDEMAKMQALLDEAAEALRAAADGLSHWEPVTVYGHAEHARITAKVDAALRKIGGGR